MKKIWEKIKKINTDYWTIFVLFAAVFEVIGIGTRVLQGESFSSTILAQLRVMTWMFISVNKHAQVKFAEKVSNVYRDKLEETISFIDEIQKEMKRSKFKPEIKKTTLEDRFKSELL